MNVKEMIEVLKNMEDDLQEMHSLVSEENINDEELKDIDYFTNRVNDVIGILLDEILIKNKR